MSYEYLRGKSWAEISRTELFFCSELYRVLHGTEARFIRWLSQQHTKFDLEDATEWEVATEVTFYRDVQTVWPGLVPADWYSPKRTFDLCLFGQDQLVIFEAKAHEEMSSGQALRARSDAKCVQKILGLHKPVLLVALVSSRYLCAHDVHSRQRPLDNFDVTITWAQLADLYSDNKIFLRADAIYKDGRVRAD